MTILKPHIHQQLTGQIWKLLIDPGKEILYAETRDAENRQAIFYAFNLDTGLTNFSDLIPAEPWLTGMDGCFDGVLFLHGYQSAQSPVHKGITAIDGITGAVLWNNYTYAIHHISINGPVAFNTQIQPQKLILLDAQNGATLRPYDTSIDQDMDQQIQVPHVTGILDDEFKLHVTGLLTGNVHYMEYNSFRIVSLHTLNQDRLNQLLLVLQQGNLVYGDLLNDRIQKLQPEAFIMHLNRLIYIKDKAELKVLNL